MRASLLVPAAIFALAIAAVAQKPDPTVAKAESALKTLNERLKKAKSLKATLEVTMLDRTDVYAFSFLRANYAKIVSKDAGLYQNGSTFYDYNPLDKEYWSKPAPNSGLPSGTAFSLGGVMGFEAIAFPNEPKMTPTGMSPRTWNGLKTSAITFKGRQDPNMKAVLFLDAATKLPVGWEYSLGDFKSTGKVKGLTLDAPMKSSDFAWNPPPGAKRIG